MTEPVKAKGPVKTDINHAAERLQDALRIMEPLTKHKDLAVAARAGRSAMQMLEAIRLLERRGASTRPDGM